MGNLLTKSGRFPDSPRLPRFCFLSGENPLTVSGPCGRAFGVALGMFVMTYHEVRPQPVVVARESVKDCPVGQQAWPLSPQGQAALVKLTTVNRAMAEQLANWKKP